MHPSRILTELTMHLLVSTQIFAEKLMSYDTSSVAILTHPRRHRPMSRHSPHDPAIDRERPGRHKTEYAEPPSPTPQHGETREHGKSPRPNPQRALRRAPQRAPHHAASARSLPGRTMSAVPFSIPSIQPCLCFLPAL